MIKFVVKIYETSSCVFLIICLLLLFWIGSTNKIFFLMHLKYIVAAGMLCLTLFLSLLIFISYYFLSLRIPLW